MNKEEKEELQELINLLYNNHLSQYGKRKLEAYIKKQQRELDKKDKIIDLTTDWIKDNCYYQDDCGNSCSVIQDTCCDITKDCKKCIIEYFTQKASEE